MEYPHAPDQALVIAFIEPNTMSSLWRPHSSNCTAVTGRIIYTFCSRFPKVLLSWELVAKEKEKANKQQFAMLGPVVRDAKVTADKLKIRIAETSKATAMALEKMARGHNKTPDCCWASAKMAPYLAEIATLASTPESLMPALEFLFIAGKNSFHATPGLGPQYRDHDFRIPYLKGQEGQEYSGVPKISRESDVPADKFMVELWGG